MTVILSEDIKSFAGKVGFTQCGIAEAVLMEKERFRFEAMIREGYHANLDYLARNIPQRFNPELLLPGCRSIIVCLYHYNTPPLDSDFRIARYALMDDYHIFLKNKLKEITEFIRGKQPEAKFKITVDTSPISEKNWAVKAGLGTIGKNSLFRSESGSFCLIGLILTDLVLDYDRVLSGQECGTCTRCMDACPAKAIEEPYKVNISRCISYHTTTKGTSSAEYCLDEAPWIFGCDICQEVCPHNASAVPNPDAVRHFSLFLHFKNKDFEQLNPDTFNQVFANNCIKRGGYEKLAGEIKRVQKYNSGKNKI